MRIDETSIRVERRALRRQTMTLPMVTVVIPTYNHVRWIGTAIESALMQQTHAPVEILVSEDASSDGTRALVERLAVGHPDRIRVVLSERNVRSNEVVARGLRAARGRYVCLLDGDDYWTDPTKVQRQADFLDAHPECSAVFHNAFVVEGDHVTDRRWTKGDLPARLGEIEIWEGNPFATCAGMMRTDFVRDVPAWYADFFPITDWPLYVLCNMAPCLFGRALRGLQAAWGRSLLQLGGCREARQRRGLLPAHGPSARTLAGRLGKAGLFALLLRLGEGLSRGRRLSCRSRLLPPELARRRHRFQRACRQCSPAWIVAAAPVDAGRVRGDAMTSGATPWRDFSFRRRPDMRPGLAGQ